MNDLAWNSQAYLGMQNQARYSPETAKDILATAQSETERKIASIKKTLGSVPGLQEEFLNLEALLSRLEGREDE